MPTKITSEGLRAAVDVAVHAPSIHNTQPWRWTITTSGLQLRLDPRRVLAATDPDAHSAALSCGAALRLAQIALRSAGWLYTVEYSPDPTQPELLAMLEATDRLDPQAQDERLVTAALARVSDRRLLDARQVAPDLLEQLRRGSSDGEAFVQLVAPTDTDRALWLAVLTSHATGEEQADPAQVAELRDWVRHDKEAMDGVPPWAVPQTVGGPRHSDVPQRDYAPPDSRGGLTVPGGVDEHPAFAVVMTIRDTRADHVRAGEAMMQLMLDAWVQDVASCPVSQAVDHVSGRLRLGQALGGVAIPQMILRLGTPMVDGVLPTTPRRPPVDVIDR